MNYTDSKYKRRGCHLGEHVQFLRVQMIRNGWAHLTQTIRGNGIKAWAVVFVGKGVKRLQSEVEGLAWQAVTG